DVRKPLVESMGTGHTGREKLKPGKPFTFATVFRRPAPGAQGKGEGKRLAFGLPGFPVSSLVTFEVFVRPALRKMQGYAQVRRPSLPVRLGFHAQAVGDRTE